MKFIETHSKGIFVAIATLFSFAAAVVTYRHGLVTSYNDSMSHLNIARLVVDNIEPNIAQLGSVWLPLNHVLSLLLIWNDWAWQSGFAGAFISMGAFIISAWAIYVTLELVTSDKKAAFVGGLVFVLNVNMLYLQATPLTEPLYVCLFILSVLYFTKWVRSDNSKYLFILGLLGLLQVLTRYDGWFVVGIEAGLIAYYTFILHKWDWHQIIGKLIFFLYPVVFGALIWLFWNYFIYGDMLYFMLGPYSAHAQQELIGQTTPLITKYNVAISSLAYWYDVVANIGLYVMALSFVGFLSFFLSRDKTVGFQQKLIITVLLLAPIIFNILALYLGFSILNVPDLKWMPTGTVSEQWFNVRYGVLALPLIAFFVGILASSKKIFLSILIVAILLVQQVVLFQGGIITVIDGTMGTSAFVNEDIAAKLRVEVAADEFVLMSTSSFNAVAFRSGLQLRQIIHEGVSKQWPLALNNPENFAKWVVMANGSSGEPVYRSLVEKQQNRFLMFYKPVFMGEHSILYKLKEESELFVRREGSQLLLGKKPYVISGVNSYDLAYKSEEDIIKNLEQLSSIGVNTIRFWMFGDGIEDGFQPKAGTLNEERLQRTDFLFSQAKNYQIRLIPVLVNNWEDFGGKLQYLDWTGNPRVEDIFYKNQRVVDLFKNYINSVISRKNSITGVHYRDESSILGWEIMNEPRSFRNEEVLSAWSREISQFIKDSDSSHLVLMGTERVSESGPLNTDGICREENIDVCSVHLYLVHDDELIFKNTEEMYQLLDKQLESAHSLNKPLLLGEFGISKQLTPFDQNPLTMLSIIAQKAHEFTYAGALVWNWSLESDNSFGFSPNGADNEEYNGADLKNILVKLRGL